MNKKEILEKALSYARGNRFHQAIKFFEIIEINEISNKYHIYEYARTLIELNKMSDISILRSRLDKDLNILLDAIELRKRGKIKESIIKMEKVYEKIQTPILEKQVLRSFSMITKNLFNIKTRVEKEIGTDEQNISIMQFWDKNIPEDVSKCMNSWKNITKNHVIINDLKAINTIKKHYPEEYLNCYINAQHPCIKSDFFRYLYLDVHGGFYIDADELPNSEFNLFLENVLSVKDIFICNFARAWVANGNIIYARKNNTILKKCISIALDNMTRNKNYPIWRAVGPAVISQAIVWYIYSFGIEEAASKISFVYAGTKNYPLKKVESLEYKTDERDWRKMNTHKNN